MWMLSFLPDGFLIWVINLILIAGLAGTLSSFFLKFIPPLIPYAGIIKIVGIILLVAGVWFRGGYDVEMSWRKKADEQQAKIAISEQQSKDANKQLDDALKAKDAAIKAAAQAVQQNIKRDAARMDATCKVDPVAITDLNEAAKNVKVLK